MTGEGRKVARKSRHKIGEALTAKARNRQPSSLQDWTFHFPDSTQWISHDENTKGLGGGQVNKVQDGRECKHMAATTREPNTACVEWTQRVFLAVQAAFVSS